MGLEKQGSKGGGGYVGGFFQLFDWNGKSRKKLLYNKVDLPEGTKQGKRSNENFPTARFGLTDDDENIGIGEFCTKGSSDFSCASSSTEGEGNGIRAPGVVARLMGLDSLPTSSISEPYSTPLFEPRALQERQYQRKTPEYHNEYQISSSQPAKVEGFCRKTAESRPQKQPCSPIERFRTETVPPKSAKSHPVSHHKLLSPIKSPGFIPPKNAADIIEAAAKILEPGYQAGSKSRFPPSLGSSSLPTRVRDLKENSTSLYRQSRPPEAPRRQVESNAVKYLKGQSLNKSWNGPEDTPTFKASSDSEDIGSRNKGKSISLAIQAKVNVQRREGLSSSGKTMSIWKEEVEHRPNQPFKSQPNAPKNRQNKSSSLTASDVLRQNNQKQNCGTSKEKLPSKSSISTQQSRRVSPGENSIGRNKSINKVCGSSRNGYKNEIIEMTALEKEDFPSSKRNNLSRKKRAMDGDYHSEKSSFNDTAIVERDEKFIQPRSVINERLKLAEDSRRKGMDVVSFTFTSPMVKPIPGSRPTEQTVEKDDTANICLLDAHGEKNSMVAKSKKLSSLGLNVIGGDALSILLEQKLRELTSEIEPSSRNSSVKAGMDTTASVLQDLVSTLGTISIMPREFERKPLLRFQKEKSDDGSDFCCSSTNSQVLNMNHNLQVMERIMECSSSSDARKELDIQHLSPVSILDASFSNESCNLSESLDVANVEKLYSSLLTQVLVGKNCPKKVASVDPEAELCDSASSAVMAADRETFTRISIVDHVRAEKQELEYVGEILFNANLRFENLSLGHARDVIDPHLFHRLESQKIGAKGEGESWIHRRALFDCVSECLDSKCSRYICGGYKAWAKGVAMVRKQGLADEVYKEILGWRTMGDWMVDELVEKDMSSHLGRWLDFEAEAFQIGFEIERWILRSLLDEVVAELMV